jgi:hypothetical protein
MAAPKVIVELGVLDGYSTIHLGKGARYFETQRNFPCHVYSFDLFEDYEFKHGNKEEVERRIREEGLQDYITLQKGNAFEVHNQFQDGSVTLLHIDISNDGDKISTLLKSWYPKLSMNAIGAGGWVLIEGGSVERDHIEWMELYNKVPIRTALYGPFASEYYHPPMVLPDFPSLTILRKKRNVLDGVED